VEGTQEEKKRPGYIHGFNPNLLLSCQILSVPLLTDASDIYMGSSFSPKCHPKTSSQTGVGSEKVRANQISMRNALWDGVLTSRGLHFKGNLHSLSVSAARTECVDQPELSLMKCLSSLEPLKRRSFKGINHLLSQGEGV